ncbi:MAG: efflux RND transporter periplasmic adaptor subunit [Planctomycetota bacterium]
MEVQPRTLKLNTPAEAWFQTKPETTGPGASAEPLDVNGQLGRQLLDAAQRAGSVTELVGMLTRAVQAHSECLGLWLAPKRTSEDAAPEFRSLLDQGENPLWHAVEPQIAELARRAQETGELQVSRVGSNPRRMLALVPLRTGGKADELLAGCFERVNGSSLPPGLLLLLVAQAIAQWRKRRAADSLNQINLTFSQTFQAMQAVALATGRTDAAIAVVNHVRQLLDARQVVLATPGKSLHWRIEAISDVEAVEARSEHATSLQNCFAAFHQFSGVVNRQNAEPRQIEALTEYCQLAGTEDAVFLPLSAEGRPVGGMLVGMSAAQLEGRGFGESAAFIASQFGPAWALVQRTNQAWYQSLGKALIDYCPVGVRKHLWLLTLGLVGLLCCPFPHQVSCHNELHPVQRRFLAAPFECVLESVLARSVYLVEKDQLLARMDGSVLQLERSGLQAQLAAALKKRDSALASGNIAESQIARSEARRCESQLALVDSKLSRLELRSPIAGVVVSGDMDKVEGARLEMGKTLFEVAPLEKMMVELQVPETDARHVQEGQTARMKFNAYPFRSWEGKVARVHPRSELVGESNVFIAEVELDNDDGTLRPGMKGWGKVAAGWRPLGWIWLHHAWERFRYVLVW